MDLVDGNRWVLRNMGSGLEFKSGDKDIKKRTDSQADAFFLKLNLSTASGFHETTVEELDYSDIKTASRRPVLKSDKTLEMALGFGWRKS